MEPQVEAVTEPLEFIGEGPHWDDEEQCLYFVGIFDRCLHKYVPATGRHTTAELDDIPTFIIPVAGRRHHFAVGLGRRLVVVRWTGEGDAQVVATLAEVDTHAPTNRFNDGKADPRGRLFAGTMGHEYEPGKFEEKKGALYRFDPDGTAHTLATDIDISNGLCWDLQEKAFYYADSFEYVIRRYDYDVETGDISNPRPAFKFSEHGLAGIADGMTIDTDGNLWVANFDGSRVLKIDPRTGQLLQKVPVPALQVTSCTWGGAGRAQLWVTSGRLPRPRAQPAPAGATFRITGLGARGHRDSPVHLLFE